MLVHARAYSRIFVHISRTFARVWAPQGSEASSAAVLVLAESWQNLDELLAQLEAGLQAIPPRMAASLAKGLTMGRPDHSARGGARLTARGPVKQRRRRARPATSSDTDSAISSASDSDSIDTGSDS